jgi:hypothetical protein
MDKITKIANAHPKEKSNAHNQKTTNIKFIFTIGMVSIIFFGLSINDVHAFIQSVRINIDKGPYSLGDLSLIITNMETDDYKTRTGYDSIDSPQNEVIYGTIDSLYLDKIQACAMISGTTRIACDYNYAKGAYTYIDFFIDMATARSPLR